MSRYSSQKIMINLLINLVNEKLNILILKDCICPVIISLYLLKCLINIATTITL